MDWVAASHVLDAMTKLVAVTADALDALDAAQLPHEAVAAYADLTPVIAQDDHVNRVSMTLSREIETYIARRYPPARFEGPGFLSAQAYWLQNSLLAVATRVWLMRETIRALSPAKVTAFEDTVDWWFASDGSAKNPWLDVLGSLAAEWRFDIECVDGSAFSRPVSPRTVSRLPSALTDVPNLPRRAVTYLSRKTFQLGRRLRTVPPRFDGLHGLRLLMADSLGYDWTPVLAALAARRQDMQCYALDAQRLNGLDWTYHYTACVRSLWGAGRVDFLVEPAQASPAEAETLSGLFNEWQSHREAPPTLNVANINLYPALERHLKALVLSSPALARHADEISIQALDRIKPQVVCFYSMPWLAAKRLAFQSRLRGIPAVCYQHGGAYGTHVCPSHEQIEFAHADYFLTYGAGVRPRETPVLPHRAAFVPVGSARIDEMIECTRPRRGRARRPIRVLWVGGCSTRNTYGGSFVVEDTKRYRLQRRCLEILGAAPHLRVTYRTYTRQLGWEGTARWIDRSGLRISVNKWQQPINELVRDADVVFCDAPSSTVWNEVVVSKTPLVLYCDPDYTPLFQSFETDLGGACCWCRSTESFVTAVERLAADGHLFLDELEKLDPSTFVEHYVLHRRDGQVVSRVVAFLAEVACRLELTDAGARTDEVERSRASV